MTIIHSPTAMQLSDAIVDVSMAHQTPFVLAVPDEFTEVRTQFDGVSFWAEYANFKLRRIDSIDKPFPISHLHLLFSVWGIDTSASDWDVKPGDRLFRSGVVTSQKPLPHHKGQDEPEIILPDYEGVGCVYFVQARQMKLIKIGYSSNVQKRLKALSTGCPDGLDLLCVIKGDQKLEGKIHQRFAADRVKGEWFKPSPSILSFIKTVGA